MSSEQTKQDQDDPRSKKLYVGGIYCTKFGHIYSFTDGVQNKTCECGEVTND
jgi:hypothetical protein